MHSCSAFDKQVVMYFSAHDEHTEIIFIFKYCFKMAVVKVCTTRDKVSLCSKKTFVQWFASYRKNRIEKPIYRLLLSLKCFIFSQYF